MVKYLDADFNHDDSGIYVLTELIPGRSLYEMFKLTTLKLSERVVAKKCKEILDALYYLE